MTATDRAGARHRVFFALWPDETAADRLQGLAARRAAAGGRAMRRETLHLTLAFIGSVAEEDLGPLENAGRAVSGRSFGICLDRLGYWQRGGILHAAPGGEVPALRALAKALAEALAAAGFPPSGRSDRCQHPHVTLLRNAPESPAATMTAPIAWQAREFLLVESRVTAAGSDYRRLASFPLADTSPA